ncbi:MAG: DUF4421 family protein [Bdellovibrionales bacterium]
MHSLTNELLNLPENETGSKSIFYQPNSRGNAGLTFQYGNVGASLYWAGELSEQNKIYDVKTNAEDYQLRLLGNRVSHKFYYQRYKGYYIGNMLDFPDVLLESNRACFRNSEHFTKGVGVIYNFSPENTH